MRTRQQLVTELLRGLVGRDEEYYQDHVAIAYAIINGDSVEKLLSMNEVNRWPDTYVWIKNNVPITEEQ